MGRDPAEATSVGKLLDFNPRAPCGARPRMHRQLSLPSIFQSTRPVWGATRLLFSPLLLSSDFNPRAPCGARLRHRASTITAVRFQSTRPVWGATFSHMEYGEIGYISIHAPRVGRDLGLHAFLVQQRGISIHAPRVGRDGMHSRYRGQAPCISIHAPRVGRDERLLKRCVVRCYFNPRAPCGARHLTAEYVTTI